MACLLCVFDTHTRTIVLSRDRVGKKPLFYYKLESRLYFASEQKALFSFIKGQLELNQQSVSDFLSLGYLPLPSCSFAGFSQVPPGSVYLLPQADK